MSKTPKTETVVLTANQEKVVYLQGTHVNVLSCTAATFAAAFDEDAFQTFYPGMVYPDPDGFSKIRVRDTSGAGSTIVLTAAHDVIFDARTNTAAIVAMAASMANIDADTDNLALILAALAGLVVTSTPVVYNAATRIPMTTVLQDGAGVTQLVVANAATKRVEITASPDNAGWIFLAYANDVTSTLCVSVLTPGGNWAKEFAGDVYACGSNGTEKACGAIY
jgi:hypothetical protein